MDIIGSADGAGGFSFDDSSNPIPQPPTSRGRVRSDSFGLPERAPILDRPAPPFSTAVNSRGNADYNSGLEWVKQAEREIALAKAIEFTNVDRFEPEIRRMPVLVLHELAHAYHDQVIPGGYQNTDILGAFQKTKAAGTYDSVKR